jgi:serine/threonine-protein kinase
MDDRCRQFHAKLLSGTCPWCGRVIVLGEPKIESAFRPVSIDLAAAECRIPDAGQNLEQLVREFGRFSYPVAVNCVREIAKQLALIHKSSGFYGRICPGNIFLDNKGKITLDDEGSGDLRAASAPSAADERAAMQAVDYLAPEQALSASEADVRSDIYALGCTLFYLLVGRPPFADGSVSEKLLKHQTMTPTPIGELRPDVPQKLTQICARMLAKRPSDRYESAAEVVDALADVS